MNCLNCLEVTLNPKFCCRSCSTSYNNRLHPKRKPEHICKICNCQLPAKRRICDTCTPLPFAQKTLREVKGSGNANTAGYPTIRNHSRRTYMQSGKLMSCKECGYNLHVDICHIKDINQFDLDTKIATVNALNNLVALCKNHHWEFDNGHLQL